MDCFESKQTAASPMLNKQFSCNSKRRLINKIIEEDKKSTCLKGGTGSQWFISANIRIAIQNITLKLTEKVIEKSETRELFVGPNFALITVGCLFSP